MAENASGEGEGGFDPSGDASDEHRLGMLMDYTKFHIGLYSVIIATLLALSKINSDLVPEYFRVPIIVSVVLILLAGFCGGIIAGNLHEQKSFQKYWNGPACVWGCNPTRGWLKIKYVARAEHVFFWLAVLNGVAAVLLGES